VKKLFLLALLAFGCTDPDPYYRIEKVVTCAFTPTGRTECANPACGICTINNYPQAVYQADGCQVAGSVGVTLCVNDCSICDLDTTAESR
jgi:hypothetical protein